MDINTFYIKLAPHFKLWVSVKDKISFESAEGIPFHTDDNQATVGSGICYFLPDGNKVQIDNFLMGTGIIAPTDTIGMYDVEISRKVNRMYLAVAGIVIMLLVIAIIIF
ncbi:hypothetical protein [Flavobacterium sp.]|uniref:hypothetical protein n=1 Tax=Flavobacterium sp. TaxID=239 RepID=UPI004034EA69